MQLENKQNDTKIDYNSQEQLKSKKENIFKKKYKLDEQKKLENKFYALIEEYEKNNSVENREFLCYLTSAIFLTYKKLFPQLDIYIPFRTKSDISFIQNIQKEFDIYIEENNKNEEWNTFDTIKDLSAIKIILSNINFSTPPNDNSIDLFEDEKIKRLYNKSQDNHKFIEEVEKFLKSPIKARKDYMKLREDILTRIVDPDVTPNEFENERDPNRSFKELLASTKKKNYYYKEHPEEAPITVSSSDINNLSDLLNDLRTRVNDQLHFAILDETLPIVLSEPIITNALQTSNKYDKHCYKKNGFEAIYHNLFTPFGPVELISESGFGYYKDKKGSAYHSGIGNKAFNVEEYFELVDPNDENPLSYYLDILDSISADSLISPYEISEEELKNENFIKTPKGIAFLESEKYREMMKHIKIKETMEIPSSEFVYSKNSNKHITSQENKSKKVNTNDYLISTALAYSPYMNVCSASHTSYTSASIHHKKVIGEFVEILRKKDTNTCLREMLLRRLENIIENNQIISNEQNILSPSMIDSLKIVKEHDEMAHKLPKDISPKNVLIYAEKLREIQNKKQNEFDLDLVI